ncbi:MAG TPA: molybdenum cofactor guanylyltransferase, partial [Gammaproteobacteria bacterium]|nr:molybdenum cofactor guanylyltransferase [Gammaproteobacteria bacterium]
DFLDSGERKLGLWIEQNDFQKVDFSDQPKVFINLNNPQDFDKI